MDLPLVSVIVPNYNHAVYLDERLQSILSQTYRNLEVIILDDCSIDNSLKVIDKYKSDNRIVKVIINDKNTGSPFKQWKKGIEEANGDIGWLAESDDSCSPSFLESMVNYLTINNLVMVYSQSKRIGSNSEDYGVIQTSIKTSKVLEGFDRKMVFSSNCGITNASSAIFKLSCAKSVSNGYYNFRGAGDWMFWAGIVVQGRVGVLANPLNYNRVHGCNTTSSLFNDGTDLLELHSIYQYLSNQHIWGRKDLIVRKMQMSFSIKYKYHFNNEEIREKLINTWGIKAPFYSISDGFFRLKTFLHSLIRRV